MLDACPSVNIASRETPSMLRKKMTCFSFDSKFLPPMTYFREKPPNANPIYPCVRQLRDAPP
eukprot:scaffold301_cov243-Pinguiococcus_pyrenoidosus.AAC.131